MNSENDFLHKPDTLQQAPLRSFKLRKALILLAAVLLIAVVAGTSGYLLGMRNNQATPPSQPSSSPQDTIITQILPAFVQLSDPRQGIESYPTPTQFNPPASWQVYKSEFGYQYSYPPTWNHYPEMNAPSSGVSAPGAKYPDRYFMVERETGGADGCGSRRRWLLEDNPGMKQTEIMLMISGHPAFQLEGKSRLDDGYDYDRKSIFVAPGDTCYHLDITSRNNPEQLVLLNQIMSTFALSD